MHPKSRRFTAFSPRTQCVLCYPGHRIDHRAPKLKQFLLLLANERIKFSLSMVGAEQSHRLWSMTFWGPSAGGFSSSLCIRLACRFVRSRPLSRGFLARRALGGGRLLFRGFGHKDNKRLGRGPRRRKWRLN